MKLLSGKIVMEETKSGQCGIDFKCCRENHQECRYYEEKSEILGNTKFTGCLFLKIRNQVLHCTNDLAKRDVLLYHLKQYSNK